MFKRSQYCTLDEDFSVAISKQIHYLWRVRRWHFIYPLGYRRNSITISYNATQPCILPWSKSTYGLENKGAFSVVSKVVISRAIAIVCDRTKQIRKICVVRPAKVVRSRLNWSTSIPIALTIARLRSIKGNINDYIWSKHVNFHLGQSGVIGHPGQVVTFTQIQVLMYIDRVLSLFSFCLMQSRLRRSINTGCCLNIEIGESYRMAILTTVQ